MSIFTLSRSAGLLALLAPAAAAQTYDFHLVPSTSNVQLDSTLSLDMPGHLIGDWDATANPTGTRTLPGLFGGTGNQPVTMTLTPEFDTHLSGAPSGAFAAAIDLNALTFGVANLDLDALGGGQGTSDLTLELLFQTFRTFQPDSLYFGGIPLPLPLGQAVVSNVRFVQNAPALGGTLVPSPGCPECFAASVLVPVDFSFTIDLLGQSTPVGPFPFALPLAGTLTLTPTGGASLHLLVDDAGNQTVPDPLPGTGITDLPFDLPTILPPGGTAHLLFTATIAELTFDFTNHIELFADGTVLCAAENYCLTSPNSFGSGASITTRGSSSIVKHDFALAVTGVPPLKKGLFLYGVNATQTPFGAGYLCVGSPSYRSDGVRADAQGVALLALDPTALALPLGTLAPGAQLDFQFWYRDPSGGVAGFNLSDAIEVTFCP